MAKGSGEDRLGRERRFPAGAGGLWIRLLPLLLLLGGAEATWMAGRFRRELEQVEVRSLETDLGRMLRAHRSNLAAAIHGGDRRRAARVVTTLARALFAHVEVRDLKDRILFEAGPLPEEPPAADLPEGGITQTEREGFSILVRQPLLAADRRRIGELRAAASVSPVPYPWPLWSAVVLLHGLVSIAVLFVVTRVLRSLDRVGSWFLGLAAHGACRTEAPALGFAEGDRLGRELAEGLERMRERELRAEESFVEVAVSLARERELQTDGESGHAQRVRRYASWLAERLRFPPRARDQLEVAALCHDLGKTPPGERSPFGPGGGTEERHPEEGAHYFAAVAGLEEVAEIIRHHHENFDGTGYPERLAGKRIPLGARILRIADAYDRLRAEIAGAAMEPGDALEAMAEDAGRIFDPELFELFREEVLLRERSGPRVTIEPRSDRGA